MLINFIPAKKETGYSGNKPLPAKNFIPDWFKRMPKFTDREKDFRLKEDGKANTTVKWCSPFLDSLMVGYVIPLEHDIMVQNVNGQQSVSWQEGGERFISTHSANQISAEMIPPGYNKVPFKFENSWCINTPKGYSTLITHPLNRNELPFITLSGFVDSDDYINPINLPFLIREDFLGIIPAGTPIAQAVPIKRESWRHSIKPFDEDKIKKEAVKFLSKIYRSYKNFYWKQKDYS